MPQRMTGPLQGVATAPPMFVRAAMAGIDRPLLHVVVDTEEEFDWTAPFSRRNTLVNAMAGLHRGQSLFRRFGITPSYMVDYPVVSDPRTADILGPWAAAGDCLIGAQLHSWVTPPFEEVVCPYNSYACNLPPDLERRKLAVLTDAIAASLGQPPRIYKAGRYGMDIRREPMLRALGYDVDTSVMPYRSYAGVGGGPDFFGFPDQPFWTSPVRQFLFLPGTQSLVGPLHPMLSAGVARGVFHGIGARLRLPGMLARLGLLERINLTPEGVSLDEMCRLVTTMAARGCRVFALALHSPSFMPGGTPYTRTACDMEAMLTRIERFLEFFFGTMGGEACTPVELKQRLTPMPALA